MTCFVAFGCQPRIPGRYRREPAPADLQAYFKAQDGFWSLVRGDHATLVAMEAIRSTVMNIERFPPPKDSDHPCAPAVGDEVIVVVPGEGFVLWADESVDVFYGPAPPIPACFIEKWVREA
jgi:hypothetical protein